MPMTEFADTPAGKRLIKLGLLDAETGATRTARAGRCRDCQRSVMVGINANFGGRAVLADPEPLSNLGEALALMSGRSTVELRWLGDRYEIDRRDQFRIRGSPAETNGIDVLVIHDCSLALGHPLPQIESSLRDDIVAVPLPELPPF
jgi:hypothetical protein